MAAARGASEGTPLLRSQSSIQDGSLRGQATVMETVLNLTKTCMGTGCLALAYACQQGGLVVYTTGMLAIGAWNVFCVDRLVRCRRYYLRVRTQRNDKADEEEKVNETATSQGPPEGTSTLGSVSYFAFGRGGVEVMDVIMTILLLGIVISYLSAAISFLSDTPLTLGPLGDAIWVATLMAILSLVPDLGHLSGVSGVGLAILAATMGVIAGYGLCADFPMEDATLPLWPASKSGFAKFYGISCFGFGVVPLTYNFQDSMLHPRRMVRATAGALSLVAGGYIVIGVGLSLLFTNVEGEILHELPQSGWLGLATRLAMASIVILTAPLLIVPCGELLEGKFQGHSVLIRCGVCAVGVCVAVLLPSFVQVLAFVGCALVGFVSLCLPPVFHLRLLWMQRHTNTASLKSVAMDVLMLILGVAATISGTIYSV